MSLKKTNAAKAQKKVNSGIQLSELLATASTFYIIDDRYF